MSHKETDCKEFVLETIRKIRQHPTNLREGTQAGVALHRVWRAVLDTYSETEFRHAIAQLLQEEVLICTWQVTRVEKGAIWGKTHHESVQSLSRNLPLEKKLWYQTQDGQTIVLPKPKVTAYKLFSRILLYVVADGLPNRALAIHERDSR